MNSSALAQFAELCNEKKLSCALLSNAATLTWLTGYAPPIQTGPNPFEGGPALAWWQDGHLTLLLSDGEATAARAQGADACEYVAYTIEGPAAGFEHQAAALGELLRAGCAAQARVGIELNFLPAALLQSLEGWLSEANIIPLDGSFDLLRAVKTIEEVERVRAALSLCDLSQVETGRLMKAGISEIELWGQVKARLEAKVGGRLPVLADFIAGKRTAEIGGLPGSYVLADGDAVIADIVPRLNGYWGDNCSTHFLGEPSAELAKANQVVRETLRAGIETIRPGVRACDLDRQMRKSVMVAGYTPYPHHSGHGLGTTYHEEPRIVSYNDMALQPGMVIALEPGIYLPDEGGIRLEDVVLVTRDGCELLTHHLN
jgi:Xaa-Pro dipeptidase